MSKDEQIEEMARDICRVTQNCNDVCNPIESCQALKYAERAYNAGYRKQSVGEWQIKSEIYKFIDDVDEELFVECPFCQRRFNVPYELDDEKIFKYAREHYPYCNCGAKMKGGAE